MARITVEDCIDKFPSRFELVLVASNRARKLYSGEEPKLDRDNDKNTVIALREIAEEKIQADELKNDLIEEYQTATLTEDEELEELEEIIDNNENENSDVSSNSNNNLLENNTSKQADEIANDKSIENNEKEHNIEDSIDSEIKEEEISDKTIEENL